MISIADVVYELAGSGAQDILLPGCTEEHMNVLEKKLGWAVPLELKSLYFQSEGENPYWGGIEGLAGIMAGFCFIPLRDVATEIETLRSTSVDLSIDNDSSTIFSVPRNKIQRKFYVEGWFPFASDSGGSYLAVDMAPDNEGVIGQIVLIGNTEKYYLIADDLEEFLDFIYLKYKAKKLSERFFEYKIAAPHSDRCLTSWLEKKYK